MSPAPLSNAAQEDTTTVEFGVPANAGLIVAELGDEVSARDLKFNPTTGLWEFHTWLSWGYIFDQFGDYRYLYHYHPYGTAYAIYYE